MRSGKGSLEIGQSGNELLSGNRSSHLLMQKSLRDISIYLLGSIAPDAVFSFEEKNVLHLYGVIKRLD
jgi:hypothetical protein